MRNSILIFTLIFSFSAFAQNELLLEDFDGKTDYDWTSGMSKDFYKSIKKGFFHVVNKSKSKITWNSVNLDIDTSKNFSIETNVSLYQKQAGEAFLIYGENKQNLEFHFVRIRDVEKKYTVQFGTFKNGKWQGNWKNITINPHKKFNRITVRKKGNKMVFLINGIIEHTEPFKPFFGNTIGLGSGGPQHAVFDYILVLENDTTN